MRVSNKLQAKKLIVCIKQATNSLKFGDILAKLQQQHIFKYSICPVIKISHHEAINSFAKSCYIYILLKILCENKDNSWLHSYQVVSELMDQVTTDIKQKYCEIMEEIKEKKSQLIELILFLVFFSLQIVLDILCHSEVICHYFQSFLQKQKQLQCKACVWVNYVITGVKIRPSVYRYLVKKYYDKLRLKKKFHHRKSKTISNFVGKMSLQPPTGSNLQEESSNPSNKGQNLKKIIELNNELKLIFRQGNQNSFNSRNNSKKRSENIEKLHHSSFSEENKANPKIFAEASLRNSNAFNQKRKQIYELKGLKQNLNQKLDFSKKHREKMIIPSKQSKEKKNLDINFISSAFKFLMNKQPKKANLVCPKKASIQDWKKKLKNMQFEGDIQRVSLASCTKKLRKTICSGMDFDEQKMLQQLQQNYYEAQTLRIKETQQLQGKKKPRKGFCEFIDTREPKQIGIVKSVINFTNTGGEYKNTNLSSKGFKQQYEAFNKHMMGHAEHFLQQDNFTYRLQKVLTGTNKL